MMYDSPPRPMWDCRMSQSILRLRLEFINYIYPFSIKFVHIMPFSIFLSTRLNFNISENIHEKEDKKKQKNPCLSSLAMVLVGTNKEKDLSLDEQILIDLIRPIK